MTYTLGLLYRVEVNKMTSASTIISGIEPTVQQCESLCKGVSNLAAFRVKSLNPTYECKCYDRVVYPISALSDVYLLIRKGEYFLQHLRIHLIN